MRIELKSKNIEKRNLPEVGSLTSELWIGAISTTLMNSDLLARGILHLYSYDATAYI